MRYVTLTLAAVAALSAAACDSPGCIRVTQPVPLLERADRPNAYPGTDPRANRVVAMLPPGEYPYRATEYGKDYQWFRLRTPQGEGYVIGGPETTECR